MSDALKSVEAEIHQALTVLKTEVQAKLQALLLPSEIYDVDALLAKVASSETQAQLALIDIGRIFSALQIGEGEHFAARIEASGRSMGYAYKMIALYSKLGGGSRAKLIGVGVSKALELIREDSLDLDRLAEGGAVAGLTLDDIDRMTVRDVREQLRKARIKLADTKETTDELVRVRDERVRKLQKMADLGDKFPASEKAEEILSDLSRASAALAAHVATIVARIEQFAALRQDNELPEATVELVMSIARNAETVSSQLQGIVG